MLDLNEIYKLSGTIKNDYSKESKDFVDAFEWLNLAIEGVLVRIGNDLPVFHKLNEFDKIVELAGFSCKLREYQEKLIELTSYFENQEDEDSELEEENIVDFESDNFETKAVPDYSAFVVDQKVAHTLYEDFKFTKPCKFSFHNTIYEVRNMRDVLVQFCGILASIDIEKMKSFVDDPTMKGRKVSYFSTESIVEDYVNKNEKIPGTELYVWVNLSCNHIRNIIRKMLKKYGFSFDDFKIYLRANFSELHREESNNYISSETTIDVEKIGKYVKFRMKKLENSYKFSVNEILALQSSEWCKANFGLYGALIKKYDERVPIENQVSVNGYLRYWKETFIFNNEKYFVISQWYEKHRTAFDNWYKTLEKDVN